MAANNGDRIDLPYMTTANLKLTPIKGKYMRVRNKSQIKRRLRRLERRRCRFEVNMAGDD